MIPWKDSSVRLPDNLHLVNSCLDIVLESPHRKKVYDNEISKMLSVGYAEHAPVDPGRTDQHFCISHHRVPKQHKIRVVSDDINPCNDVSSRIHSLQEPNVTSSEAELHRFFKQHDFNIISKFSTRHTIHLSFYPPTASHMNGACERMIRTIRKVLRGMPINKCRLTDDVLHTLLVEVEGIINHRPLTKVSDDVSDDHPLTPAHLLMARRSPQLIPGIFIPGDMYRRRWKYVQYLTDEFWRRYIKEYLPKMQKRQKWTNCLKDLKIGDLVLIQNENTPRPLWPLGLVVRYNQGRDGLVRSVRVKTPTGQLVRPITKLVLLEAS